MMRATQYLATELAKIPAVDGETSMASAKPEVHFNWILFTIMMSIVCIAVLISFAVEYMQTKKGEANNNYQAMDSGKMQMQEESNDKA